jgi:hypothetical protein
MCWMEPRQTRLPATITPTLLHKASHSSMLCVVSTTLISRCRTASVIRFHMARLATGSIPLLGSSKNTTAGLPTCHVMLANWHVRAVSVFYVRQEDQRVLREVLQVRNSS